MLLHNYQLSPFPLPFPPKTHSPFYPHSHSHSQLNSKPKPHKHITTHCHSSTIKTGSTETVPKSAIQRIAEKLRSLGFTEDKSTTPGRTTNTKPGSPGEIFLPQTLPKTRVGSTLDTSWSTPQNPVPLPGTGPTIQKFNQLNKVARKERWERKKEGKVEEKVPTLAELMISEEELRRLRGVGIGVKKKVKIGKAGVTEGVVNGIHERWRSVEVVKVSCEDLCRKNMKRTHDLLERKTGGLVVWRSGSTIILYRGANYKYPYFSTESKIPDGGLPNEISTSESSIARGVMSKNDKEVSMDGLSNFPRQSNIEDHSSLVLGVGSPNILRFVLPGEAQLTEEADRLLEGLGPRFTDWWGYNPLPVDGDLLPAIIPGYRRPLRLLPYGVNPKLTNDEMTTLRRLGRPLPCHFALGRNKKLQGLAASMVKLWEKCEIVKVAVKRGVQNTNSHMMAEELKWLTGGLLLSRDREFIVFYRGKDFLPLAVSIAIEERRKNGVNRLKQLKDPDLSPNLGPQHELGAEEATSIDEFQGEHERNKMGLVIEKRKLDSTDSALKRTIIKLSVALEKKAKAEKLLEELDKSVDTEKPELDKEGITEEERYMLKKVGLRMKPYVPMGRRGVFDGTVENMHLHWKYRELVKIISGIRCIDDIYAAARTLEAESGGILVAVERVNRDYAIIVYRGKNYQRPASLRPDTLLNKKQAMRRSLQAQRRESLKLNVLKLTESVDELKHQLVKDNTEMKVDQSIKLRQPSAEFEVCKDSGLSENSRNDDTVDLVESSIDQKVMSGSGNGNSSNNNLYFNVTSDCKKIICSNSMTNNASQKNEYLEDELENLSAQNNNEAPSITLVDHNSSMLHYGSSKLYDSMTHSTKDIAADEIPGNQVSDSLAKFEETKLELANKKDEAKKRYNTEAPSKVSPLSNRDRLILRKQALKMKKRPVLAIGRSNIITGLARAITTHFQKNTLAIVNIKGRAKGTSVQEVIFKLEQATGAVLVSQEPSKVILYRGWGKGEDPPFSIDEQMKSKTFGGSEGKAMTGVSLQLMEAIRIECGLQSSLDE